MDSKRSKKLSKPSVVSVGHTNSRTSVRSRKEGQADQSLRATIREIENVLGGLRSRHVSPSPPPSDNGFMTQEDEQDLRNGNMRISNIAVVHNHSTIMSATFEAFLEKPFTDPLDDTPDLDDTPSWFPDPAPDQESENDFDTRHKIKTQSSLINREIHDDLMKHFRHQSGRKVQEKRQKSHKDDNLHAISPLNDIVFREPDLNAVLEANRTPRSSRVSTLTNSVCSVTGDLNACCSNPSENDVASFFSQNYGAPYFTIDGRIRQDLAHLSLDEETPVQSKRESKIFTEKLVKAMHKNFKFDTTKPDP